MNRPAAPHLVIDNFLPEPQRVALLAHALRSEAAFVPAGEAIDGAPVTGQGRIALRCALGLGDLRGSFEAAVHARFAEVCAAIGVAPFPLAHTETELVAHGDGGHFDLHHDTLTQRNRADFATDRVVSSVYYLHKEPHAFSGGELAIHPFGQGEPILIEPRGNRLVLFAAIAPHAVRAVNCPGAAFADWRFSVNCWLHRARPAVAAAAAKT
jgi:Rps23 Pro-64 3,4-dihydroxylase Tpa1-like proline 4-hydroxylase